MTPCAQHEVYVSRCAACHNRKPHPLCSCAKCVYARWEGKLRYSVRGWMDRAPDGFRIEIDEDGMARPRPVTLTDQLEELEARAMWELREDARGTVE